MENTVNVNLNLTNTEYATLLSALRMYRSEWYKRAVDKIVETKNFDMIEKALEDIGYNEIQSVYNKCNNVIC